MKSLKSRIDESWRPTDNEIDSVKNIIRKGLSTKGNGFKITLSDLAKESNLDVEKVNIALNTITQWNAWDMIDSK